MGRKEILEKLDEIDQMLKSASVELGILRESVLALNEPCVSSEKTALPLPDVSNYATGHTLEDLYKAFGKKKISYAHRLKKALRDKQITTLEDFLLLSPGELLELENIGYKTLLQTRSALKKLGLDW